MPTQPTFEEGNFSTSISQNGTYTTGSGTWANTASGTASFGVSNYGFSHTFGISNQTDEALDTAIGVSGALNLAPQIPYTDVNSDLAGTSETDRPWTLVIPTNSVVPLGFTLYMMNQTAPQTYNSTTHIAHTTASPAPLLVNTYLSSSSVWSLAGSAYTATIPIDFAATLTPVGGVATTHAINKLVRNPNWNGLLQFFLILNETGSFSVFAITNSFSGPVVPFHTGQMGLDIHRRARVVHDYINGFPYLSDEATEDPWREGVMVHSSSSDPTETRRHNPYVPPAAEGVVDDDIPNVE